MFVQHLCMSVAEIIQAGQLTVTNLVVQLPCTLFLQHDCLYAACLSGILT